MDRFLRKLRKSRVRSRIDDDDDKDFLPESQFHQLVCHDQVKLLLPDASSPLIDLICHDLRRTFLIVVWCHGESGNILSYMRNLEASGMTDEHLPVKNLAKDGRCKILDDDGDEDDDDSNYCTHDKALDFFHDGWTPITFKNFFTEQWTFYSPTFAIDSQPALQSKCILPFTWVSQKVEEGHFSQVREALIHPDHCQDGLESSMIIDQKGKKRAGVHVAVKQLKNLSEPGYKVGTAWEKETAALVKISKLPSQHLIRLVAAFKRGSEYFITLEWANGGNLRNFWENHGTDGTDLDADHVFAVIEQLVGLAGALSRLHNTNTNTKTANIVKAAKMPAKGSQNLVKRSKPIGGPSGTNAKADSLQVPVFQLNGEGSDDGYYTSDDVSITDENWRHGDLKPDNILRFARHESDSLGTLKIGDLGLAKQHMFATARRDEATQQKYSTLQYEAPEAITNLDLDVGRSRRYDIWSMGCIMLEFTIWLLYGWKGLQAFYKQSEQLDTATETLYFIANRQNRSAEVSDCALKWIEHILLNDPECNRPSGSAIGDLVKLIRDRLLVVGLPERGMNEREIDQCRASADDLEKALKSIWKKAFHDEAAKGSYIFSGSDRRGVKPPQPGRRRQGTDFLTIDRNRSSGGAAKNLETYSNTLHEAWIFVQDNAFALDFLSSITTDKTSIYPRKAARLCKQCQEMEFWGREFTIRESVSSLVATSKTCDFHKLLLEAYTSNLRIENVSKTNFVEVSRDGSNLMISGIDRPALSICRTPEPTSSSGMYHVPPNYIQIGLPSLPHVGSSTYYEIISRWIKNCDSEHPACSRRSGPRRIPTRLLDVGLAEDPAENVRLCVIGDRTEDQRKGMQYIALSHPWGTSPPNDHFCTTTTNLSERLSNDIPLDRLPDTFKHAAQVTRALGIQYLWIDSLCIVQGEDGDFATEAKHMETVFSSAYCVLAASRATGTSTGFLGKRPNRKFVEFEAKSNGHPFYVCEAIDNFQSDVIEGPLNKRGWVLQERALARRTIYFTENQTYWECGEGIRCETLTKMKNDQAAFIGDSNFPELATKSSRGAKIRLYESLYKQYSKLEFTKSYDRPIAIAGLEQRLVRAFKTNGGYGVFEGNFFGRSLLWQRDVSVEQNGLRKIVFPPRQQYLVPTWSWMAYEGAITFMDLPFDGVQWEQNDGEGKGIEWQWRAREKSDTNSASASSWSNPSWHTGESNEVANLAVRARDFVDFSAIKDDRRIVYDCQSRPSSNQRVRCVVVGRQKSNGLMDSPSNVEHYILIVAPREPESVEDNIYERLGIGSVPGNWIVQEGSGMKVQIF